MQKVDWDDKSKMQSTSWVCFSKKKSKRWKIKKQINVESRKFIKRPNDLLGASG